MSENLLKSLSDITKMLAENSEAAHLEAKADSALLLALCATLLGKGLLSRTDMEGISLIGQGDKELSDRVKSRVDIIIKSAKT